MFFIIISQTYSPSPYLLHHLLAEWANQWPGHLIFQFTWLALLSHTLSPSQRWHQLLDIWWPFSPLGLSLYMLFTLHEALTLLPTSLCPVGQVLSSKIVTRTTSALILHSELWRFLFNCVHFYYKSFIISWKNTEKNEKIYKYNPPTALMQIQL